MRDISVSELRKRRSGPCQSAVEERDRILHTGPFLVRDGLKTNISDVERAANRKMVVGTAERVTT